MYCGHGERSRQAGTGRRNWQGRQGSNLRQPVLETGTLPTELHPYRNQASPLIRRFKHRPRPDCKGEAVNALFNTNCSAPNLAYPDDIDPANNKSKRERHHDRANRRQTPRRPADPAPPPGQTGIARAVASPAAADVGRVQARHRQGNHAGRDHDGRPPRSDRLVRRARPARSRQRRADGAQHPVPHLLHDQADRLRRHHDAARGRLFPAQRSRSPNTFRNFPTRRSASKTTAGSNSCR